MNEQKQSTNSQLLQAVKDYDIEAAGQALQNGANVNAKCSGTQYLIGPNNKGETYMDPDVALQYGGTVEYYSVKSSPLLIAIGNRHVDMVNFLIENGADTTATEVYTSQETNAVTRELTFEDKLAEYGLKAKKGLFSRKITVSYDPAYRESTKEIADSNAQ